MAYFRQDNTVLVKFGSKLYYVPKVGSLDSWWQHKNVLLGYVDNTHQHRNEDLQVTIRGACSPLYSVSSVMELWCVFNLQRDHGTSHPGQQMLGGLGSRKDERS